MSVSRFFSSVSLIGKKRDRQREREREREREKEREGERERERKRENRFTFSHLVGSVCYSVKVVYL